MWKNQSLYRTLIYSTCFICDVNAVLGFGAVWYCRSLSTLRRNMLSPPSGLKWECREVEGLYTIWGAKDEGREPIRETEFGNATRKLVGAIFQVVGGGAGRGSIRSGVREERALFRAHLTVSLRCRQHVSLKCWQRPTIPHNTKTQHHNNCCENFRSHVLFVFNAK
jgi:hypothetical protein